METKNKTYLGDGLYAELEHGMIVLSAPRYSTKPAEAELELTTHWVALEPDVFHAFCRFAVAIGWGAIMRDAVRKEMPPEDPAAKSASTSK